jgi:hypothetical protein
MPVLWIFPTIIVAARFMYTPDKTCHVGADNPSGISMRCRKPETGKPAGAWSPDHF